MVWIPEKIKNGSAGFAYKQTVDVNYLRKD